MKIFKNELSRLRRENNRLEETIENEKSRIELQEMTGYLAASPISEFQTEVVRKDLIGMALEADREERLLTDKLGVEPEIFCDEIVENTESRDAAKEHFVSETRRLCWDLLFFYAVEYLLWQGAPEKWGISSWVVLATLFLEGITVSLVYYMKRKYCFKKDVLKRNFYLICGAVLTLIYGVICRFWISDDRIFLIGGDGRIILFVLILIAGGFQLFYNFYWNKKAKKYQYV